MNSLERYQHRKRSRKDSNGRNHQGVVASHHSACQHHITEPGHENQIVEESSCTRNVNARNGNDPNNLESGTNFLMNDIFINVVKHICERTDDINSIGEAFLTAIIDILFSVANVLKQEKPKIDKIIAILVGIGLKNRELGANLCIDSSKSSPCFTEMKKKLVSSENKYLLSFLEAYELEKQIKELTEKKMDIFSRTMALVEADNIIVVSDDETETDRVTQSLDIKPSAPHKGFSQLAVNLAINKIEKHIKKEQTELEFMSPHNIKKEISVNFPSEFNKEGLETPTNFAQATVASASSNDLIIRNFQSQTDEKIDSLDSIPPNLPMDDHLKNSIIVDALEMKNIIFDNQKQNVTALKVVKQLCIAACDDGTLHLFSIQTGACLDIIKQHSCRITSLSIWRMSVFTTCANGEVCSLALGNKQIKSLSIQEPISCAKEFSGLLYVGTSVGNIYKINVRSLTLIRCPVQVSSTCIHSIEAFRLNNDINMIVVAEGRPITLRNPDNGSLICVFPRVDNCSMTSSLPCKPNIIGFLQPNTLSLMSINGDKVTQLMQTQLVCNCICASGRCFFVGCGDGNIYIYNSEPILLCILKGPGGPIRHLHVHDRKVVICCQDRALLMIMLPHSFTNIMKIA